MNAHDPFARRPPSIAARLRQRVPRRVTAWLRDRPAVVSVLEIGFVMAAFVVLDRKVLAVARLSEADYMEPLLLPGLIERTGAAPALALAVGLAALCWRGNLAGTWDGLGTTRALRVVVVLLAAVLAWPLITHGYNAYLGRTHGADALLAVVLVAALWWRPGFIVLLVPVLAMLLGRVATPALGGSLLVHKLQVFQLLSLFAAAMLLHAMSGRPIARVYTYLALCVIAGSYFVAGAAKIELSWWQFPHLHLLPASAVAHGWLHPLEPEAIGALVQLLEPLDLPLRLAVLALEAACVLLLVRRGAAIAMLSGLIVFHLGVLALYGFFFWTWIVVDAALIVLLLRGPDPAGQGRERLVLVSLSVVLIAGAGTWTRPAPLGWFDTGLTYTYRFEGIGRSGRRYALHPQYFAPYQDVFTMTPFHYLSRRHRVLTASYGVTKRVEVARAIARATSAREILALEASMGEHRYDETRTRRLAAFVRRFVERRNAQTGHAAGVRALAPPGQFITLRPGARSVPDDPLETVRVVEVTTFFDGARPRTLRQIEVLRIGIGAAGATGSAQETIARARLRDRAQVAPPEPAVAPAADEVVERVPQAARHEEQRGEQRPRPAQTPGDA